MQQDDLVEASGTFVPYEYRCAQGGMPMPTPSVTPLFGAVYVTVPPGVGVPGLDAPDMRTFTQHIFVHDVPGQTFQSRWIYQRPNQEFPAGIACYFYYVVFDNDVRAWLPEDVLTPDLGIAPRATCFHGQIPSWFVDLSYRVPRGYEVIMP